VEKHTKEVQLGDTGGALSDIVSQWIVPQWPAPKNVRAYVTTRAGNFNQAPYDGFNTADHVGDSQVVVARNRRLLQQHFGWSREPQWLNQVHGATVVTVEQAINLAADACVSEVEGAACAIHTADCLPVFFTNKQGTKVALAHAGWRGLLQGVLENTLACFAGSDCVYAWMGPAISQKYFEVGEEVYSQFVQATPSLQVMFTPVAAGKYLCDLYGIARYRMEQRPGCTVYGGEYCAFGDSRFFSYRRQPVTGRILSLLWMDSCQ